MVISDLQSNFIFSGMVVGAPDSALRGLDLARGALSRVVLNCVNSFLSWKLNERTRGRGYSRQTRIPTMRRGDSLFMVQLITGRRQLVSVHKLRGPSPAMQVSLVSRLIFILCFHLFDSRPNKEW